LQNPQDDARGGEGVTLTSSIDGVSWRYRFVAVEQLARWQMRQLAPSGTVFETRSAERIDVEARRNCSHPNLFREYAVKVWVDSNSDVRTLLPNSDTG
jgi:hypothetical protein